MPKIKIIGFSKMQVGGECPLGQHWDKTLQSCVEDIPGEMAAGNKQQAAASATPSGSTVVDTYDIYGCVVGKETWSVGDQKCIPVEQAEPPKFQRSNTLSGGTSKTGPGTGVNPFMATNQTDIPKWKKDLMGADMAVRIGLNLGSGLARVKENRRIKKEFEKAFREANFNQPVQQGRNLGNVETNTGVQFPNLMTPPNEGMFITQFGGNIMGQGSNKVKIRIVDGPQEMKYGGQSGYGLDMGWRRSYTQMSKTTADHYKNTMSEDKSSDAGEPVIEAEGGETFIRPETDGSNSFFKLEGKRHTDGGILLTKEQIESGQPEKPSFMFSDTPDLKIKDPNILKMFGVPQSMWKKGVTPAAISKKFELNEHNAVIKDKNSDPLQKATAQMMIDKKENMLAKLGAIQESMKGEQVPVFAQQKLMGKAKLGGRLPMYQNAGTMNWTKDYDDLASLLLSPETADLKEALYQKYKAGRGKNDNISKEDYIATLLEGQRQKYIINEKLAGTPELTTEEWDKGGANTYYNKIAKKLGLDPQSGEDIKRSQEAFLDMYDLLSSDPEFSKKYGSVFNIEYKGVPEPKGSGYEKEPTRRITKADTWRGNTDIGQLIKLASKPQQPAPPNVSVPPPGKTPVPPGKEMRYVCAPDPNNKGKYIAKGVMVTEGSGGFTTPQEAEAFCNRSSPDVPFGYTAPDAYNMFASSAVFPRLIMPFVPTAQAEEPGLNLEDWRARTANRFATQYAAPAQTLAAYTAPQGLASNLSKLSGEAAQAMAAQDMAPVIGANINRSNAAAIDRATRRSRQRELEAAAQKERWTGSAVALQQYDNAIRGYLKDTSKAFDRAWNNRQKFGDINATNVHFFKNPWSGRQIFKPQTAGFAGLGYGSSNPTGSDLLNLGSAYGAYYNAYLESFKDLDMDDKEKKRQAAMLAQSAIRGSKQTQRTDRYGNPIGGSQTMFDLEDDEDVNP